MLRTDLAQARKFTYRAASCERLDLGDLTADVEEHNREFYLMAQAFAGSIARPGPRSAEWGAGRAPSGVSPARAAAWSSLSGSAKPLGPPRHRSRPPAAGRALVSCGRAR